MKNSDQEMQLLKEEINNMWELVLSQVEKAKQAFMNNDTALALDILALERRVNAFELKVDSNCENYIALFSPVAIDLRLVLSTQKIGIFLERIGDLAAGVAHHIADEKDSDLDEKLKEELDLEKLFDTMLHMLSDCFVQYKTESTRGYRKILAKKEIINTLYHESFSRTAEYLKAHPEEIPCGLRTILLIHRLERIGDYCSNIVEEIVFYVKAKVLKHKGKTE